MFGVSGGAETFALMQNYEVFGFRSQDMPETVFALTVENGPAPDYTEELRQ